MKDWIPRRLRVAFAHGETSPDATGMSLSPAEPDTVDFVAYGVDCVLSGRTVLDGDRLSDMLNDHDEYALIGVSVERFDGGAPIEVKEVLVARDELWLVHASGPRGAVGRRTKTAPQFVAVKMGPYQVRGFFHTLPGSDPDGSIGRRKPMVPLTHARIEYTIGGQAREVRVDTVIINREQVEWLVEIEPDRREFPTRPMRSATVTDGRLRIDRPKA
jgi:hypothetical protein